MEAFPTVAMWLRYILLSFPHREKMLNILKDKLVVKTYFAYHEISIWSELHHNTGRSLNLWMIEDKSVTTLRFPTISMG